MGEDEVNTYNAGFDLGYLSCAIDSEGTVSIYKSQYSIKHSRIQRYRLFVRISNNDLDYLDRCQVVCSNTGYICPHTSKKDNRNANYIYVISNKFFREIMPYLNLTVKKKHLKVAERFNEIVVPERGGYRHTEEEMEELEQLYLTMKELNKRGFNHKCEPIL